MRELSRIDVTVNLIGINMPGKFIVVIQNDLLVGNVIGCVIQPYYNLLYC